MAHRIHELAVMADDGSHSRPAEAVAFGLTVDHNHSLTQFRKLEHARRSLAAVIDELAIDLVGDHEEIILLRQLAEGNTRAPSALR